MLTTICENKNTLGHEAAVAGSHLIRKAIREQGGANIAFVTGTSQLQTLLWLSKSERLDWSKVNIFLLDEFLGLEKGHKASSSTFLKENFLSLIPPVASFTEIDSDEKKVKETVRNLNEIMRSHPLDVAFICIGENGHLAFNDPPADFDTKDPYIVVELDTRSRRQQANEGWFKSINDVPKRAITMSVHEILSAKHIICSCPDQRKAKSVAACIFDEITPLSPCAALRNSLDARLFLDRQSSKLVYSDGRRGL